VSVEHHPLRVEDGYLDLPPWYHVFGEDPSIEVYQWQHGERPNPFCLSPATIHLVNFVPGTLVIELIDEEGLTLERVYEGYIERGNFRIRVEFDEFVPSGFYYFSLVVGDDRQEEKMRYIK
jgi:hypothetical protein